jgi:hypothetical protein
MRASRTGRRASDGRRLRTGRGSALARSRVGRHRCRRGRRLGLSAGIRAASRGPRRPVRGEDVDPDVTLVERADRRARDDPAHDVRVAAGIPERLALLERHASTLDRWTTALGLDDRAERTRRHWWPFGHRHDAAARDGCCKDRRDECPSHRGMVRRPRSRNDRHPLATRLGRPSRDVVAGRR